MAETHYKVIGVVFEWIACNPMCWFSLPVIFKGNCASKFARKKQVTCKRCKKTRAYREEM